MGCVLGRDAASPPRRRPSAASSRRLSPHPEPQLHLSNIPSHREGELIAAGWPDWLAAAAGDAIYGWTPCPANNYQKLDKIGRGTYSNVYKGREISTNRTVALKCVRPNGLDPQSIEFMAREIVILRRLDNPNVIKLEGIITSKMSNSLFLVFEYMDHDLAGLNADQSIKFSEPQVKCYMKQLLAGIKHCHGRGVLHRDIKGPNLLLNNSGVLKIADFGLAAFFDVDDRQPMTSKVVTLWYRSPELLLGATEYGVGVDLWSAGCILGELLARRPILPGRTEVEQLHKIFKLCGSPTEEYWLKSKLPHAAIYKPKQPYKQRIREIYPDFTPSSLSLIETLLSVDPAERQTASSALRSEYFCRCTLHINIAIYELGFSHRTN